jgi:hypothetical protein
MTKRVCKGTNAAGKPCGASPLKGTDRCAAHPLDPASTRFGSSEQASAAGRQGGRPKLPTPTEVARDLIEQNIAIILRPHFRTLGYDVETSKQGVVLVPLKGGGAKLYGESRDGVVRSSEYEDLGAQIAAADKLLDRIYGRPKQATELTGPGGGPIAVSPNVIPDQEDWHAAVLRLGEQVASNN